MKITHIIWSLQTGGVETMLVNIINEQVKSEEVQLIIINDIFYTPLLNKISPLCKICFCHRKPKSKNPWSIIKLNYWLMVFSPNIIHLHSYRTSCLIWGHYNLIRTIHNTRNDSSEYSKMKGLFSISKIVREYTLKQGFDSIVIDNGIPTRNIKRKITHLVNNNYYKLVQIGRLHIEQKGQDLLIEAINELVNKRGIKNLHMSFIGEGKSRSILEQMVKDYKLDDYITFEGRKTQDYLFTHLCEYDCLIQPSRYEGFGLTVAEGIAAGLPVLVSDTEGPMEIIEYGTLGMSFKNEDINDLANKLESILKGEYDYSLIEKAIQKVYQNYDVELTAKKYINEYRKILYKEL